MSLPIETVFNDRTKALIESGAYTVRHTGEATLIVPVIKSKTLPSTPNGVFAGSGVIVNTGGGSAGSTSTTSKTVWVDDIREREVQLGFDPIPICRPQFIKFHFKGLKPNTNHYFFFDNRDMTNFTTTNATQISNYEGAARNDIYRDPGETYINATSWPLASGASGTIKSTSAGELEGIFYLQRNSTTYFNVGSITMNVIDVSDNNFENCLSYAAATFSAGGVVSYSYMQSYVAGQKEVTNPNYVAPTYTTPSSSGSNYDRGGGNDNATTTGGGYSGPIGTVNGQAFGAVFGAEPGYTAPSYSSFSEMAANEEAYGGSPGGDPGTKVICTALYNMGLLPHDIYVLDAQFGLKVNAEDPELGDGYRFWATPVAEYIKGSSVGSRIARAIIKPIATAWAQEMAHIMKPDQYKSNIIGKAIMFIGHPICRSIGKAIKFKIKEA